MPLPAERDRLTDASDGLFFAADDMEPRAEAVAAAVPVEEDRLSLRRQAGDGEPAPTEVTARKTHHSDCCDTIYFHPD